MHDSPQARFDEFCSKLQNATRQPDGSVVANCPHHEVGDGHKPSLVATLLDDGKILLNCRSQGCDWKQICHAAGFPISILFPPKPRPQESQHVATYQYRDEHGDYQFEKRRFEPGFNGEPKTFVLGQTVNGEFRKSMGNARRVPYNLDQIASRPDETIYLLEGEKACDYVAKTHGLLTTTLHGGGGKTNWPTQYNEHFRGRDVVIVRDNDKAGEEFEQSIAAGIECKSLRLLHLPDMGPKWGLDDWLQAPGNSIDEFKRQVQACKPVGSDGDSDDDQALLIRLTDYIDAYRNRLLVDDPPQCLPLSQVFGDHLEILPGSIVQCGAPPNAGKSALLGQLGGDVIVNDIESRVLFLNCEMTVDEILDRLMAHWSNVPIEAIRHRDWRDEHDERHQRRAAEIMAGLDALESYAARMAFVTESTDLRRIEREIETFAPTVVIVDYTQQYQAGGDLDDRQNVDHVMRLLRAMVKRHKFTALCAAAMTRESGSKKNGNGYRAGMSALRSSGMTEYGTDVLLLLNEVEQSEWSDSGLLKGETPVDVTIVKNRFGPRGKTFRLIFDGNHQRFRPDDGTHVADYAASITSTLEDQGAF